MALINIVPFDLNRSPGRPTKTNQNKGTPKTTATDAVHKTPEQRPIVNQGFVLDRRRLDRRNRYQPMKKDRRAALRRNRDTKLAESNATQLESPPQKTSIDIKV